MFDDPTRPMVDQLLEEMERQGYEKDAIETARVKLTEKYDLNYATKLAKVLATINYGKEILDDDHAL